VIYVVARHPEVRLLLVNEEATLRN